MFKPSTLLILVIMICSCQTDVTIPCDDEGGESGKLCREYLYTNDVPVGFKTFEHQLDTVLVSYFFDNNSEQQKSLTEKFEDGRLYLKVAQFENSDTQVETRHYNEMDSLTDILYGANDSATMIFYEGANRTRQEFSHADSLNRYEIYRYYQDDGRLYKISTFDASDQMMFYRSFEYFSTGQNRIAYYTPEHRLIGRELVSFSQLGLITSTEFTDSTGTVIGRENYIYNAAGKLTEQSRFGNDQTSRSVFLYY